MAVRAVGEEARHKASRSVGHKAVEALTHKNHVRSSQSSPGHPAFQQRQGPALTHRCQVVASHSCCPTWAMYFRLSPLGQEQAGNLL